MSEKKMSQAESLVRAHAANRRKRLDKLAAELRENGFFVLNPEDASIKKRAKLPKAA